MKPQDVDSWDVELEDSKNSGLETTEYLAEGQTLLWLFPRGLLLGGIETSGGYLATAFGRAT